MSLLSLEQVTVRFPDGSRDRAILDQVSLRVEPGELVAVWGARRSGRTTLLRVAGGLQQPAEGVVRFAGRNLDETRNHLLGSDIAYTRTFMAAGLRVVDQLAAGLLARGVRRREVRARAHEALERVDAAGCGTLYPTALSASESVRVTLARALVGRPRLLLVDEPTTGVDVIERDPILRLLHSLADHGMAILMTAGETPELTGSRALWINDGRLHGDTTPAAADVVALHPRAS